MTQTRWAIDGPDDAGLELEGRRFSSNDEGAPMMCNFVCSSLGRHVHIDYCRARENARCDGAEVQHINARMVPDPDRRKDAITHSLYWRRLGFKDPYTRDEQINFARCDAMCSGPEHSTTAGSGRPSYCTLPLFHPPRNLEEPVHGRGYISNDGHLFNCRSPSVMQQAFHVIFVVDKSSSMGSADHLPLAEGPAAKRIQSLANNRLGAVYSALYNFWSARHAAVAAGQRKLGAQCSATRDQEPVYTRPDSYSIILFNAQPQTIMVNDVTSSPDQLLDIVLRHGFGGGTEFANALTEAQDIMVQNWSKERRPIMIFLSDGECTVSDAVVRNLCRKATRLGKPLSFHSVLFSPDYRAPALERMAQIALKVQENDFWTPRLRGTVRGPLSSFTYALDTVQLTETFLGIADSMRKPRGSLVH